MSNTRRHINLVGNIATQARHLYKGLEICQENAALVHLGNKFNNKFNLSLIDLDEFDEDVRIIDHLSYIQPDIIVFQHNKFIWNERETRIAGCPDLAVEIWSYGNTKIDREEKFLIYSSSSKTEHWHIEQDNNEVKCYLGKNILKTQSLLHPLRAQNGLEFDLTHLAL